MKKNIWTFILLLLGLLIRRGVTLPSHFLTQQDHIEEDQQVINNLLREDQEILQEEEIEISGKSEISHKSANRKLPSYLENLQDIEEEGDYEKEHEEISDMTLARAWLPFEIKGSLNLQTSVYQFKNS
jgi:hypothetical protein